MRIRLAAPLMFFALSAGTLALGGCSGPKIDIKPKSAAYTDGFEVVVKNPGGRFTRHTIKDAESLVESGASFDLDAADVKRIESDLDVLARQESGSAHYPFTKVRVDGETIELSCHFSKSTYYYTYKLLVRNSSRYPPGIMTTLKTPLCTMSEKPGHCKIQG